MNSKPSRVESRRKFLITLGLGSAGVAAAAIGKGAAEALPGAAAGQAQHSKGYQLSEHVKRYYRSTRI